LEGKHKLRRRFMRIFTVALICLLLPLSAGAMGPGPAEAPDKAGKPGSPLNLSIEAAGPVVPGAMAEFLLRIESSVSAGHLEVKVRAVGGAEIEGGKWSWTGPVDKGSPLSFPITVLVPEKGGGLRASAVLRVRKGDRSSYGAKGSFMFGKGAEPENGPSKVEPTTGTDGRGRAIKEYRAK
jgi:hypothetical protein